MSPLALLKAFSCLVVIVRSLWIGRLIGILRLRSLLDDILFQGEGNVLNIERNCFRKL
jgi:hypothetical protein